MLHKPTERCVIPADRRRPRTASIRPRTSAASATAGRSSPIEPISPKRVRRLRVHGMTSQYVHEDRVAELQDVGGRGCMVAAGARGSHRRCRASAHDRRPLPAGGATPAMAGRPSDATPTISPCCAVPIEPRSAPSSKPRGVATAIHYPLAITQQPAYRDLAHALVSRSPRRGLPSASACRAFRK